KVGGSFTTRGTVFNKFKKDDNPNKEQIKNLREGYIGEFCFSPDGSGQLPTYQETPMTLLMHNVVKDEVQCPTEEVGGVFSREAIAAGTTLRGEIRLRKSAADKLGANWWTVFQEKEYSTLRLGTSRKDDYGLAELKILTEPTDVDSQSPFHPSELTVYLLSDVLLRNSNLRQTNAVADLAEAICRRLNAGVEDNSKKVCLK